MDFLMRVESSYNNEVILFTQANKPSPLSFNSLIPCFAIYLSLPLLSGPVILCHELVQSQLLPVAVNRNHPFHQHLVGCVGHKYHYSQFNQL